MIRWPADKAMVTAQVSQVQEQPDSAAIPLEPACAIRLAGISAASEREQRASQKQVTRAGGRRQ